MSHLPTEDPDMPSQIDFSKGVRGIHHIPLTSKVFVPVSIEKSVWEYFSGKSAQTGIDVSELVSDALKRDIQTNNELH